MAPPDKKLRCIFKGVCDEADLHSEANRGNRGNRGDGGHVEHLLTFTMKPTTADVLLSTNSVNSECTEIVCICAYACALVFTLP